MIKSIALFSSLAFLQGCLPHSKEVRHCLSSKEMLKGLKNTDITLEALPAFPLQKLHYWTLNILNHSLVIPVDEYKTVVISPSNEMDRVASVKLMGSTYTVELGGSFMSSANGSMQRAEIINTLKPGVTSKLSDVTCASHNVKDDLKTIWGIAHKAMLMPGSPSFINKLDTSSEGWLFTSKMGVDNYEWRSLLIRPESFVFEYSIKQINAGDYKQMRGLLSKKNHYIVTHAAENPPEWMPYIIDIFDTNFDSLEKTLTSTMKNHDFIPMDTSGLSVRAFKKEE